MSLRRSLSQTLPLLLVGLMVPLTPAPASAQVRAALTKNVDEPGRMPFQASALFAPSACSFNSVLYFCSVSFPAVPAGKRLIIDYVTHFVALAAPGSPDSLRFQDRNNGNLFWVQPTYTPRALTPSHFFLDRPVHVYYEAGDTPKVLMAITQQLAASEITVSGYFIDATN